MKVEDLRPRGAGWNIRLHEKGGKHHLIPCHQALAEVLHSSLTGERCEDCGHSRIAYKASVMPYLIQVRIRAALAAGIALVGTQPGRMCRVLNPARRF